MKLSILLGVLLISVAAASALEQITVEQGRPVTLHTDTGSRGYSPELTATYRIPEVGFYHFTKVTATTNPIITEDLAFNLQPGTYLLFIDTTADKQPSAHEELLIVVVPPGQLPDTGSAMQPTTKPSKPVRTTAPPSKPAQNVFIEIPAIPDVTPGSSFVMPVTVTGKGTYVIGLPKLSFGSYDVPGPFVVDGEKTVPVLIKVDKDAKPGTYVIPVSAGGEQTSTRIRIISYVQSSSAWLLQLAGAVLIIIGIILIALYASKHGRKQEPREPQPPKQPELITYY